MQQAASQKIHYIIIASTLIVTNALKTEYPPCIQHNTCGNSFLHINSAFSSVNSNRRTTIFIFLKHKCMTQSHIYQQVSAVADEPARRAASRKRAANKGGRSMWSTCDRTKLDGRRFWV